MEKEQEVVVLSWSVHAVLFSLVPQLAYLLLRYLLHQRQYKESEEERTS